MGGHFSDTVEQILATLRARHQTLAVAESLTGGLLGGAITDVAGASDVFVGGVIAYSAELKRSALGVDSQLIAEHGVVSREVAIAMAAGVQLRLGSDWAISTTGVAGPGASDGVAAGTVWIAIATPDRQIAPIAHELSLTGDRSTIRQGTIDRALAAFTRILRG